MDLSGYLVPLLQALVPNQITLDKIGEYFMCFLFLSTEILLKGRDVRKQFCSVKFTVASCLRYDQ